MIVAIGVAAAIFVVAAVIGIFYFAGNRGQRQDAGIRQTAAKGERQGAAATPGRTEGRGDL